MPTRSYGNRREENAPEDPLQRGGGEVIRPRAVASDVEVVPQPLPFLDREPRLREVPRGVVANEDSALALRVVPYERMSGWS